MESKADLNESGYTVLRSGIEAFIEEWRYKGGSGAWQEGYGPDQEEYILDICATRLRNLLGTLEPDHKQQRAKAAISVAFMPAYRALEAAIEELEMDWTAHSPVQGERATKVLAWQAMEAAITALEDAGYLTTPEPDHA